MQQLTCNIDLSCYIFFFFSLVLIELKPFVLKGKVLGLVAQNRESRIARFPESRARNRQKFRSEKQKNELNRSKVESQKIDSESPSESQPTNAEDDLGIARFESHDSESPDSRFRIADSVPLRSWVKILKRCEEF